jgi:thioredoxin 1
MLRRSRLLALALVTVVGLAVPARASEVREYNKDIFWRAAQQGQRVLVIISSRWRPSRQDLDPIIYDMANDFRYRDVLFLQVDFDRRKDALHDLRVNSDATVIVYKGGMERGRMADTSSEEELRRLLDLAR